jgi:hypothetical protein
LLCGLCLGALLVFSGCGGSTTTETRGDLAGRLKETSAAHGKRMKEFYDAKKANKGATKGKQQ